jgi:hypothetical protein
MNSFNDVLIEKERKSIVSSLIETDKDKVFLEYLNQEGRMALLTEILNEYPPSKKFRTRTTAALYSLIKSLGISRPLIFLSDLLESKPANINQRIQIAIEKGYLSGRSAPSYQEAKTEYIKFHSGNFAGYKA